MYLLQQSFRGVAVEEAGLDKALAVPHEMIGEEARVHAVSSPAPNSVRDSDDVSVPLPAGDLRDTGVIRRRLRG